MTLTIHTEQDEQRQLLMTVEVAEERVTKQMRQTARKMARQFNIPGFRKGKAPYNVIVNRVGEDYLRTEAVEELLQPVFEEALSEVDPDIYAQAQFDDMEMEPLVLKFTIPLTPEVTLGDYRTIRKEIEEVSITDEAVDEALEAIQARHQELEDVDRPVEAGDMVTFSGKGVVPAILAEADADNDGDAEADSEETTNADVEQEEIVLFDTQSIELAMDSDKLFKGTTFVENMIGLSVGESKSFSLTFPEDYEDEELAGREANFDVEILNVKNRTLPALDDALAEEEGHENLEAMRESTRTNLQEAAESEAKNELIEEMIDNLVESATLVYPPAAVSLEIDSRIESFKNQVTRSGWEWEDYLKLQSVDEDSLREDFREGAEEGVQRQLVLRQFVLDEKLRVTDEDIDAKLDDRLSVFGDNPELAEGMRDYYKSGYGLETLSSEILMDKAYERIVAILSGEAPDLDALEAEESVEESAEEPAENEEVGESVEVVASDEDVDDEAEETEAEETESDE